MTLPDVQKTVAAVIALAVIGWGAHDYLSQFANAAGEAAQHQSIRLLIQQQEIKLDSLYTRQIENMVGRISVLRARKNKTEDDLSYLRYLESELETLKKDKANK